MLELLPTGGSGRCSHKLVKCSRLKSFQATSLRGKKGCNSLFSTKHLHVRYSLRYLDTRIDVDSCVAVD